MNFRPFFALLLLLSCSFSASSGSPSDGSEQKTEDTAQASDNTAVAQKRDAQVQEQLQVLGSREQAEKTPGSAHYISKQDLEQQNHTDIHRILLQVPGVYVQEEDGLGLRPNIGFRGTGVERSSKITLMEDGVLIAPAPYTAPAAYYFPTAGRMESVEVLKGPATVTQGPYTNGGALNMVSTSIPGAFGGDLNASMGSHNTQNLKANLGGGSERFGWLVETFQMTSDGFKELDGNGETGSRINDYLGKFRLNSTGSLYQFLELKLGVTKQFGHETYLGLTEADFAETPNRRYAASQNDYIDADHEQYQLRHYIQPLDNLSVTTTVYHNDFFRNWHKAESTLGVSNATILSKPEQYAAHLAILRGETNSGDNALLIRNNNRNYISEGIQTTMTLNSSLGESQHELEVSLRHHEDEEDRLQHDERYRITDGLLFLTAEGTPGSQSNRLSSAQALSAYVTDTIAMGSWTFRPGLRFEQIDYELKDFAKTDPARAQAPVALRKNDVNVFLPGLGLDYNYADQSRVFLGIYRGFSPPGAGQNENTQEERSTNYELGIRHTEGSFFAEAIGFYNDYHNLLGTETVSGGGTGDVGDVYNGGKVEVKGVEASFRWNLIEGRGFTLPLSGSYTYTRGEFKTSFETSFEDWGPSVAVGDELPYIPNNQLHLELGYHGERLGLNLGLDYSDEMRTKAGQGAIPAGEGTDSHTVFDLGTDYKLGKSYKIYARVRNLSDETYVVARRPYGLRPGLERSFLLGAKANF